jgi:hypothetical protein
MKLLILEVLVDVSEEETSVFRVWKSNPLRETCIDTGKIQFRHISLSKFLYIQYFGQNHIVPPLMAIYFPAWKFFNILAFSIPSYCV